MMILKNKGTLTGNAESTWCDSGKMRRRKNGGRTATRKYMGDIPPSPP
jgi:hypothetical protein